MQSAYLELVKVGLGCRMLCKRRRKEAGGNVKAVLTTAPKWSLPALAIRARTGAHAPASCCCCWCCIARTTQTRFLNSCSPNLSSIPGADIACDTTCSHASHAPCAASAHTVLHARPPMLSPLSPWLHPSAAHQRQQGQWHRSPPAPASLSSCAMRSFDSKCHNLSPCLQSMLPLTLQRQL
jgi:hypothetical protein